MDKKSKRRIKRGLDFNKEMANGKYGWSELAIDRLFHKLHKF